MTPITDRIRANGGEVIRDHWLIRLRRGRLSDAALEWLRKPRVKHAVMLESWGLFEEWQERAAIREFDGGQPRDEAERDAYMEVMAR